MKNQIKFRGYTNSYRIKLKKMKFYEDSEYRLLDVFVNIADWDKKHINTFGTTGESLRDIQKHYLPNWSLGKLSQTTNKLIKKGDITKRLERRIEIKNFWRFVSSNVQKVEQSVQADEQNVQQNEQPVQPDEQPKNIENHDVLIKNQLETIQHNPTVQPTEHQEKSKETLNQPKEHQINYVELLTGQYGNDINAPIKKYGVEQVSEAAKITEARIDEGENIKNKIGCITNLCKEGVKWEGSEWQLRENQRKIQAEEKRRKFEKMIRPPQRTPEQQEKINKKMQETKEKFGW